MPTTFPHQTELHVCKWLWWPARIFRTIMETFLNTTKLRQTSYHCQASRDSVAQVTRAILKVFSVMFSTLLRSGFVLVCQSIVLCSQEQFERWTWQQRLLVLPSKAYSQTGCSEPFELSNFCCRPRAPFESRVCTPADHILDPATARLVYFACHEHRPLLLRCALLVTTARMKPLRLLNPTAQPGCLSVHPSSQRNWTWTCYGTNYLQWTSVCYTAKYMKRKWCLPFWKGNHTKTKQMITGSGWTKSRRLCRAISQSLVLAAGH